MSCSLQADSLSRMTGAVSGSGGLLVLTLLGEESGTDAVCETGYHMWSEDRVVWK